MADVLIRDLDQDVMKRLKSAAKLHGRSLQAELREVLRRASVLSLAETRRLSAYWQDRQRGKTFSDSTVDIRAARDAG